MKVNPKFKKTAFLAVEKAGIMVRENFNKKLKISLKKGEKVEYVTNIDVVAEKIIRKIIKSNFPDHDILGEELGGKIGKGFTWVIDPIDGTSNYLIGLPLFSIAIALLEEEKPILSVVFNPVTKELYWAEKGKGAFLNKKRIEVNKVNNLSQVLVVFNKGKDMTGGLKILTRISSFARTFRCFGSAHLEICMVASGKSEGFIAKNPQYYDMGAGSFIAEEAGGRATDFGGKQYTPDSKSIIVTNSKIHNQLLKLIK